MALRSAARRAIGGMIRSIQPGANEAVQAMGQAAQDVSTAAESLASMGQALQQVVAQFRLDRPPELPSPENPPRRR